MSAFRPDRLLALRKARGLTQEDVAVSVKAIGGKAQISKYEKGHITPSSQMVYALAEYLECSADYLLGMADEPHSTANQAIELSPLELRIINLLRAGKLREMLEIAIKDMPQTQG